jgi:hypothetical protein
MNPLDILKHWKWRRMMLEIDGLSLIAPSVQREADFNEMETLLNLKYLPFGDVVVTPYATPPGGPGFVAPPANRDRKERPNCGWFDTNEENANAR